MSPELILASHRLPIQAHRTNDGIEAHPSPGGLARALNDLLQRHTGTWIGYPGLEGTVEFDDQIQESFPYSMIPIAMDADEVEHHYRGFSNQILWPLFHDLHPYCDFEPHFWDTYKTINERYARTIAATGHEEQIVWIHDYHLFLVPRMLRELGDHRLQGFFLHVPFPHVQTLQRLPWHQEIIESLLEVDLIGFQTPRDLANFTNAVDVLIPGCTIKVDDSRAYIETDTRSLEAAVFPISIDAQAIHESANSEDVRQRYEKAKDAIGHDQTCIVGVERLDYTKGVPERLRAFQQTLEKHPELRGNVTLFQHINPSREELPLYGDIRQEVEGLVGQINGLYGTMEWVPVRYSYGNLDYLDVLALYRLGDVALVTPLRDGMNLVAKEYCMAKGDQEGVLILSRFAGAAEELGDSALLVNPHDVEETAEAIHTACTMDMSERRERIQQAQQIIRGHDVHAWARGFLEAVGKLPPPHPLSRSHNNNPVPELERLAQS